MNKNTWGWWALGAFVVVALIWVYQHRVPVGSSVTPTTPLTVADPFTLPGIQTSTSTWPSELGNLAERMAMESLPQLTMEGEVLHIHQHLDIFVNGQSVPVPVDIGRDETKPWLSPIHTHDARGVIHVESPYKATFTLGEVFDVWGLAFTANQIGGYKANATSSLKIYVNGELYTADPRALALDAHQQITIVYGTAAQAPATIPSSYTFKPGE